MVEKKKNGKSISSSKERNEQHYGEYLLKNKEKLIKKRKKKRLKNKLMLLFVLLVAIGIYISLKQEIFNLNSITVSGNKIVKTDEIKMLANVRIGDNIFMLKDKEIKGNILINGYIKSVTIKRKFPDEIILSVEERNAFYYEKIGDVFYILDKECYVLESKSNINSLNLLEVKGLDFEGMVIGEKLKQEDIRKESFLSELEGLVKINTSGHEIVEVDLSDMNNINLNIGKFNIRLGSEENLKEKLNKAINIYLEKDLENLSGYIEVGFEGNPVIYINETNEETNEESTEKKENDTN
ncbi:cell division protein FtsQ/DivIB [Oceanirhabdus seepicola]|uniref:FtsQ-type POTRA domain-containing protein n=1 Tax=Oceanirhabdus seepicola TaxID=2828781 RepID=A0A9J6P815_9CLOT|nr:FtsQ-type POTRA domain-containing protein [Oceanirhabdus seepicola]MCM1992715.1 FtsQ-type POTRA domain-containing protein [Oceanirhabdus seepicola]